MLPALLASATLTTADAAALDAQVAEVFRPYRDDRDDDAPWNRPIFSQEVTALIAHWQRVLPPDEPDRLNDGDWLCQCQDWDAEGFRASAGPAAALSPDSAEVPVKVDLGFDDVSDLRTARLVFKREADGWKLDDLYADESFPQGLKQALRETIAEDEALAAGRTK